MQFNKTFFEKLNSEDKEYIETLYQGLAMKEISLQEFFNTIHEAFGEVFFNNLFSTEKEQEEVKPEQLSDIIQYSGIDLKQENESIADYEDFQDNNECSEDLYLQTDSLLEDQLFFEFINNILLTRQMNMRNDVYQTLFMALKRKLYDLIDKIIDASNIRVDIERSSYNKQIINDVKRQLWLLEQNEQKEVQKLHIKIDDEHKKRLKKATQEREDVAIKKKLSNTVALAALGGKKFNWLDENDDKSNNAIECLYAPYDEREFLNVIKDRTITKEDFLFILEHDKRYNKSIFTIQQYFISM